MCYNEFIKKKIILDLLALKKIITIIRRNIVHKKSIILLSFVCKKIEYSVKSNILTFQDIKTNLNKPITMLKNNIVIGP